MASPTPHGAWRLSAITALGVASGLPLALTGTALQAWLTVAGVDVATIGILSLVGLPYTFKFLWAPLMDRFEPAILGRRRTWLVLTQAALALALWALSRTDPTQERQLLAGLAVLVAFLSASQDIVVDAYRTDLLAPHERGLGSSLSVLGYRLAMVVSGGFTFVWADAVSGYGWSWGKIYSVMAGILAVMSVLSMVALPPVPSDAQPPQTNARHDLRGFLALAGVLIVAYLGALWIIDPTVSKVVLWITSAEPSTSPLPPELRRWADLVTLLITLSLTLPVAVQVAKAAKFETLSASLGNFFETPAAWSILALVVLYKLGDAFAGSLITTFLLKGAGFAQAEVGVVNKVLGIWLTILGALAGGAIMTRVGLYRSLLGFGILQLLSNVGFWLIAVMERGAWGSVLLPSFDLGIVALKEATTVDVLLMAAVAAENITGGMGTTASVALLMALCQQKFSATQYALLSAVASVGRVWVGPVAGALAPTVGWGPYFLISMAAAVPGLLLLVTLRRTLDDF